MLPDETKVNFRDEQNTALFLAKDFEKLYEINYPLLVYLIKRYNAHIDDHEEAVSLGNLCFAKTLKVFNPERAKFSTYLGMTVKAYFSRDYRDRKAKKRNTDHLKMISLQQTVSKGSDSKDMALEELLTIDTISVEDQIVGQVSVEEFIEAAKTFGKSDKAGEVLKLRLQGLTQMEIAEMVSIRQTQVSRILTRLGKAWGTLPEIPIQPKKETPKQENKIKPYKEGEIMSKPKNSIDKLEESIRLIEQNVVDIDVFAESLGVTKQLAKTYRFAAEKEIEKRKKLGKAISLAPAEKIESIEEVVPVEEIAPEEKANDNDLENKEAPEPKAAQKRKTAKAQKEVAPQEKVMPTLVVAAEEKKVTTISGDEQNPAIATIALPQTPQKRLRPTVIIVASETFEFKVENNSILITLLSDEKTIALPKENLQDFIDDLEQIVSYL